MGCVSGWCLEGEGRRTVGLEFGEGEDEKGDVG